jgi:iron complex outermembrane receptor protein
MGRPWYPVPITTSVGLLCFSTVALAQEPSEVTVRGEPRSYAPAEQVSASRAERDVAGQPQGITVLRRDLIDDLQARRIEDVLPLAPGVQLGTGNGGTWDDFYVRGFRVWSGTLFRNGFRAGYSGPSATDTANIERIEVLRGPASALWGAGLPGGSIDIVTKRPQRVRSDLVGLRAGSFGTLRAEFDATGPVNDRLRYRVVSAAETTDGPRDFNHFRRLLVNPSLEMDLSKTTSVFLEFQGYFAAYRADPFGVPIVGGDPHRLPVTRTFIEPDLPIATSNGGLGRAELVHRFSPKWSLVVTAQSQIGGGAERDLLPVALSPDQRTLSRIQLNLASKNADTALQVAIRGRTRTGSVEHEIVTGVDLGHELVLWRSASSDPAAPSDIDVQRPSYGTPLPPADLAGPKNRWTYRSAGIYASDLVAITRRLAFLVSGRVDTYQQQSDLVGLSDKAGSTEPSARAGLVVRPLDPVVLYGNVSRGFWPVIGVAADGGVLEPERSLGGEAGVRFGTPRDRFVADAGAFFIRNTDISVADPNSPQFQVQRGVARSVGTELLVTAKPAEWARLLASYAYVDAAITEDPNPALVGTALPYTARHSCSLWWQLDFSTPTKGGPTIGAGTMMLGSRTLPDATEVPGFARFDGSIGWRTPMLRTTLRVENMFDTRYVRAGTNALAILPGPPRSAMLSAELLLR